MSSKIHLYVFVLLWVFGYSAFATHVEVKKENNRYCLYRDGERFFIKGAGGVEYLHKLKAYGGNSIRIWSAKIAKPVLDSAEKLGLFVTVGLDIELERRGFDYNDSVAVKKQFEAVKAEVMELKDHPALLMWGVGNELDQLAKNPKVWSAMNDIVKMIHEVDGHHPTTTMMAGVNRTHLKYILDFCPELDILSINSFKDLPYIEQKITDVGWKGPYIIGEWGASGYWEVDTTTWGASIEETSSEKADVCEKRYKKAILAKDDRCLGSFVFYWGEKQARTNTFLSLILFDGEETETVDFLQTMWSGTPPANLAPRIKSLKIDDYSDQTNVLLKPGTMHTAKLKAYDPNKDPLNYSWEVRAESAEVKVGGDTEALPALKEWKKSKEGQIEFMAPNEVGAYRLYVFVRDGKGKIGFANFPFYVMRQKSDIVKSATNY